MSLCFLVEARRDEWSPLRIISLCVELSFLLKAADLLTAISAVSMSALRLEFSADGLVGFLCSICYSAKVPL